MEAASPELIACLDCDRLHRRTALPPGHAARCVRCGRVLYLGKKSTAEQSVALACGALLLWVGVLRDPFMTFDFSGQVTVSRLTSGVGELWAAGRFGVALAVATCAVVLPILRMVTLLWLQVPLLMGVCPPQRRRVQRLHKWMASWGMLDVFLLATLVAFVKFADYGGLSVGTGFYAFVALIFVSSAAHACFDADRVWRAPERVA